MLIRSWIVVVWIVYVLIERFVVLCTSCVPLCSAGCGWGRGWPTFCQSAAGHTWTQFPIIHLSIKTGSVFTPVPDNSISLGSARLRGLSWMQQFVWNLFADLFFLGLFRSVPCYSFGVWSVGSQPRPQPAEDQFCSLFVFLEFCVSLVTLIKDFVFSTCKKSPADFGPT